MLEALCFRFSSSRVPHLDMDMPLYLFVCFVRSFGMKSYQYKGSSFFVRASRLFTFTVGNFLLLL